MKANKNVHSGESIDKEQMNLSVSTDTKEIIKREAKDRYGSTKRMGQVLDEIVSEWMGTDDTEIKEQLDRIENKLEESEENNSHTHTSENDEVDEELLDKIDKGAKVNPDDYDLTKFKGSTDKVVKAGICVVKYKHSEEDMEINKKNVMGIVQRYFDYSINAAREKRDMILKEFEVPIDEEEIIRKCVETEIEEGYNKTRNGKDRHSAKPSKYRNKYDSLKEYLELSEDIDTYDIYADMYQDEFIIMLENVDKTGQLKYRKNLVLDLLKN